MLFNEIFRFREIFKHQTLYTYFTVNFFIFTNLNTLKQKNKCYNLLLHTSYSIILLNLKKYKNANY